MGEPTVWIGLRQRQMLEKMWRFGEGWWRPEWRITSEEIDRLARLERKGLVVRDELDGQQAYRLAQLGKPARWSYRWPTGRL